MHVSPRPIRVLLATIPLHTSILVRIETPLPLLPDLSPLVIAVHHQRCQSAGIEPNALAAIGRPRIAGRFEVYYKDLGNELHRKAQELLAGLAPRTGVIPILILVAVPAPCCCAEEGLATYEFEVSPGQKWIAGHP